MADAIQRDGAAGRRNRAGMSRRTTGKNLASWLAEDSLCLFRHMSRRVTKKPSALLIFFKGSIIMVNVEKVVGLHNAEEWRSRNGEKKS